MNRRGFLRALTAVVVAPFVPTPGPVRLKFHRDAFAFVMAKFPLPNRFDVLYGVRVIQPTWCCRLSSEHEVTVCRDKGTYDPLAVRFEIQEFE